MLLSEKLKVTAQPILRKILKHPFIQGIANGNVPKSALIYYVKNDYQYLNNFINECNVAISKTSNPDIVQFFKEQIQSSRDSYGPKIFCQVIGINHKKLCQELPQVNPSKKINDDSLLEILTALGPCLWTYNQIASNLSKDIKGNPFNKWIRFYNNSQPSEELFKFINQLTKSVNNQTKANIIKIFLNNCKFELNFWNQAYNHR